MKRYSILGILLQDYTAREALRLIDHFLDGGAMNTVTCITAQKLQEAARQETVKNLVENTDLTICVEADILEAAGIASSVRIKEIEEMVVLWECLKKVGKNNSSVYLLGGTQEDALALEEMVWRIDEDIRIVGCAGYEAFEYQPERLMNAINEANPQVVFSRMAWPMDLELMHQGRKFLNAQLWFALPDKEMEDMTKTNFLRKIRKFIFRKKVNEYNHGKTG